MRSHCLLSDKPSAPGCVVLLVAPSDETVIRYCHPGGDGQWARHDYDIGSQVLRYGGEEDDRLEKIPICPIAACRGKFYFNSTSTELGVLEFCPDPVFSSIAVDDDTIDEGYCSSEEEEYEDPRLRRTAVSLVGSGDELYRVSLLYAAPYGDDEIGEGVIEKMDFSERRWRGVDDLGGRAFLLSKNYYGASCSGGKGGLQKNCVYIVYPREKEMQDFDVKEGTNELQKLDEAPASDKAFWLLGTSP